MNLNPKFTSFRPFKRSSEEPGRLSANQGPKAGSSGVPEKAPQLPPLNLDPANPHGLQRSEGGRRTSIDQPNPDMARFFDGQTPPPAFNNNHPVSGGFEAMYWKNQNHEMGKIWGKEQRAVDPPKPSAMEMHRRMKEGPEGGSPLLESTIRSLPKESRDLMNGTHNWTVENLREKPKPQLPEFRFGGDAPPAVPRMSQEAQSPIAPVPPRPPSPEGSFRHIIIPDLE